MTDLPNNDSSLDEIVHENLLAIYLAYKYITFFSLAIFHFNLFSKHHPSYCGFMHILTFKRVKCQPLLGYTL